MEDPERKRELIRVHGFDDRKSYSASHEKIMELRKDIFHRMWKKNELERFRRALEIAQKNPQ